MKWRIIKPKGVVSGHQVGEGENLSVSRGLFLSEWPLHLLPVPRHHFIIISAFWKTHSSSQTALKTAALNTYSQGKIPDLKAEFSWHLMNGKTCCACALHNNKMVLGWMKLCMTLIFTKRTRMNNLPKKTFKKCLSGCKVLKKANLLTCMLSWHVILSRYSLMTVFD